MDTDTHGLFLWLGISRLSPTMALTWTTSGSTNSLASDDVWINEHPERLCACIHLTEERPWPIDCSWQYGHILCESRPL